MALVQWSDALSVNVDLFDSEHKELMDIINRLYDAHSQGEGADAISVCIKALSDYTITHFTHEEEFLANNYPDLLALQQEQHAVFVDKVNEFHKRHDEGTMTSPISMFAFLGSWFVNHIQKVDVLYAKEG